MQEKFRGGVPRVGDSWSLPVGVTNFGTCDFWAMQLCLSLAFLIIVASESSSSTLTFDGPLFRGAFCESA
jgi:hypothetical protein